MGLAQALLSILNVLLGFRLTAKEFSELPATVDNPSLHHAVEVFARREFRCRQGR
jgi:hypothetical protein